MEKVYKVGWDGEDESKFRTFTDYKEAVKTARKMAESVWAERDAQICNEIALSACGSVDYGRIDICPRILDCGRSSGKYYDYGFSWPVVLVEKTEKLAGHDLSGKDLSYRDFTKADLSFADLRGANMQHAILRHANLAGTLLPVTEVILHTPWDYAHIQHDHIHIGCQYHSTAEWESFTDDEISKMAKGALDLWKTWKDVILLIASKCEPYGRQRK